MIQVRRGIDYWWRNLPSGKRKKKTWYEFPIGWYKRTLSNKKNVAKVWVLNNREITHNETRLKIKYEPFGCNFPKGSKLHRRDGSCGTGGKKIWTDHQRPGQWCLYQAEWTVGDKCMGKWKDTEVPAGRHQRDDWQLYFWYDRLYCAGKWNRDDAWEQRHLVEPISDGMGGTIYNIPYKNAGYESGYINTGAQMDYITIVTLDESTDLITAFLSFGDYHKW